MSLQQAEEPPPYSSETKAAALPSVPATEPGDPSPANDAPTSSSKPIPVQVASPNNALLSREGARPGIILQPVNLPAVPSHDPQHTPSPQDVKSAFEQTQQSRAASVSYEDANDRMAAEALCGLGKAESKRPPRSGYETPLKYYPIGIEHTQPGGQGQEAEPLLSLLTSSHPWLGGTINGSLSAYSSTKSFSPRFVRAGADLVENTVGSVGRKTGVEDSIRRYLEPRRSGELDHIDPEMLQAEAGSQNPRAPRDDDTMDIEQGPPLSALLQHSNRRTTSGNLSVDSLPAYDKNSSPPYEDSGASSPQPQTLARLRSPVSRSWSTQLMISTSGLGAALSESSLRSLKFCLSVLNGANRHVRALMDALKKLLQELSSGGGAASPDARAEEGGPDAMAVDPPAGRTALAERIKALNSEIWQTLRTVVTTVSRYTGGALPENASVVVRWQLMSVPQRWRRAGTLSSSANPGSAGARADGDGDTARGPAGETDEAVGSANRMVAFAIEGIDMMEQVSGVVDSTITSAERWLDSFGRRKGEGRGGAGAGGDKRDADGGGGGEGEAMDTSGGEAVGVKAEKDGGV